MDSPGENIFPLHQSEKKINPRKAVLVKKIKSCRTSADFDIEDFSRLFATMENMISDGDTEPGQNLTSSTALSTVVNFGENEEELVAANDARPASNSLIRKILGNGIRIAVP